MASEQQQQKCIAFFGATGGVGLSALKHNLAAGNRCVALCRTADKLKALVPAELSANLEIKQGNIRDASAVSQCLVIDGRLVDTVVFSVGGAPILSKLTVDDPLVCREGIAVVLDAITKLRGEGVAGRPHVIACSTTGMSKFGRDVPLAMVPLYHVLLKVPHEDKGAMEERLSESGEDFTVVRMSMLYDGETTKTVRVGVEDPKTGRESCEIGYFISREDSGKWIADNLVLGRNTKYDNKIVMITT
ncbi:Oxidase pynE [Paramyrothecium foliicola]|nr:Oxidase pynE [Paramyrothecium foliicola]